MARLRNFWLSGTATGRRTSIGFGPALGPKGEMELTIYQRNQGIAAVAAKVLCYVGPDGLVTKIYNGGGKAVYQIITER
jgi:hypothetical protein